MNILVVAAHPDDETIAMGGTLKKLSKDHFIKIMFLADGVSGRRKPGFETIPKWEITKKDKKIMLKEIEERKIHAKNALKHLGVKEMSFFGAPSEELSEIPMLKITKLVEEELSKREYNVIFTHHYNDLSNDHKIAFEASITAARPLETSTVSTILSFEVISAPDWNKPYKFRPNLFIDISSEIKTKLKALSEYKHEIRKFPHPRSNETTEAVAKRWGSLNGFTHAEAFEIVTCRMTDLKRMSLF
jgi:N-acetylglucosamine malate deacetylase 1